MKVPKYILESIEKASRNFSQGRIHERKVRDWLDKNGLEDDETHDNWIDNIEYGKGAHEDFIEYLLTREK
jgi:hypothetical protein